MKLEMLKRSKGFLTVKDMCIIFEVSKTTIYSRINQGKLPQKDCIGGEKGWDASKLRKFLGISQYKNAEVTQAA